MNAAGRRPTSPPWPAWQGLVEGRRRQKLKYQETEQQSAKILAKTPKIERRCPAGRLDRRRILGKGWCILRPVPFRNSRSYCWNHSERYRESARQTTFTFAEVFPSPFFMYSPEGNGGMDGRRRGGGSHSEKDIFLQHCFIFNTMVWEFLLTTSTI